VSLRVLTWSKSNVFPPSPKPSANASSRGCTRKQSNWNAPAWMNASPAIAAKEAVSKALGSGIGKVHWRDIIILKYATGQPYVELAGTAALLAESLHLSNWSVSITHTGTLAAAFAVAIADE